MYGTAIKVAALCPFLSVQTCSARPAARHSSLCYALWSESGSTMKKTNGEPALDNKLNKMLQVFRPIRNVQHFPVTKVNEPLESTNP